MDRLTDRVQSFFAEHLLNRTIHVAFSGGLDSQVLLHLASRLHSRVKAIHVNHGVHSEAQNWEAHCRIMAANLSVEFISEKLSLSTNDAENTLRQARYAIFSKQITAGDVLLTAHHLEDQAETFMLQLLRGAGPRGLSAMSRLRPFSEGLHARPLLDISRADIRHYAEIYQLDWLEDPSNTDTRFARNFLRHEVFPLLQKRWENAAEMIARAADNCAETDILLENFLAGDLLSCLGSAPGLLSVQKLLQQPVERRAAILRTWMNGMPSRKKLQQIAWDMLQAGHDRMPCIAVGEWEVRRYRDDLYFMPRLLPHDASRIIHWDMKTPLVIENIGVLHGNNRVNVTVRFREGGETIQLPGSRHHHSLKKIFQQKAIPPWLRDRIPLIYSGNQLIASTVTHANFVLDLNSGRRSVV